MEEKSSREKILKKVRAALMNKSRMEPHAIDFGSNIYPEPAEALELVFAQQFSEAGGQFIFCENEEDFCYNVHALTTDGNFGRIWCGNKELQEMLNRANVSFVSSPQAVEKADTSITACEFLVARTGSILVSSMQDSGRRAPVFPHQHIVVAKTSQFIYDLKEALKAIKTKYAAGLPSMVTLVTGPSRTADIEKTLILGAHGPKEIYVFMIDDMPATNGTGG